VKMFSCPSSRYTSYTNLCISATQIMGCYLVNWPVLTKEVFINSRARTIKFFLYFCLFVRRRVFTVLQETFVMLTFLL
jgi:succinate-acetate transporter protein